MTLTNENIHYCSAWAFHQLEWLERYSRDELVIKAKDLYVVVTTNMEKYELIESIILLRWRDVVVPVQWLEDDVSRHCVVGSIHNLRVPRNVCFSTLSSCTQVGNSQPIIAVGLWGARRKVPRDRRSRGRDIASSALCPLTSPL